MKYTVKMGRLSQPDISVQLQEKPYAYIEQAESEYRAKIRAIATQVLEQHIPVILITGPSASGKTTTAKRLATVLEQSGKQVSRISLDNFYLANEDLPFWEDGYQNYESIEGLDLRHFEHVLGALFANGHAEFPIFDFTIGNRSKRSYELDFTEDTVLIFEGIHALNPLLYNHIGDRPTLKIYISTHSDFVCDDVQILSARDLRLSRRLLRDFLYRNSSAEETLQMWKYVLRGEELYIRPHRKHADVHIDSTHGYEPFLYHDDLGAMLEKIQPNSPYYDTVQHLAHANAHFFGLGYNLVPADSLIQEFIKPLSLDDSKIQSPPKL